MKKHHTALMALIASLLLVSSIMSACGGGGAPVPPVNQAPNAVVTATPPGGVAPLNVQYDASGSTDADGTIATYDWDMDGDGTFEVVAGVAAPAVVNYAAAGNYTVSVRVNDNGGLADTATVTIVVTSGGGGAWTMQTIDTGNVGDFCSLAMVSGRPAIAYQDAGAGDLKYMRAADATGATWAIGSPMTIVSTLNNEGLYNSLAVVNGNPAVSFLDDGAGELRYIRADSADGSTWGDAAVTVEVTAVWTETTLLVVNGNPAIAYDNNAVMYEQAVDADGTDWSGAARKVDGAGETGLFATMAVVDGSPAIAFMRTTPAVGALYMVRAGDANGAGPWQVPLELHADAGSIDVGRHPSLGVVNGNPAVAYEHWIGGGNADPFYIRSNAVDGGAGTWDSPAPISLDAAAALDAGGFASLAVIGGVPQVAFYDYTSATLWHVRATDATGSTWLQAEEVDNGGVGPNDVGMYCSMQDVGGNPGIAYFDDTANALKYALYQ